MERVASPAYGRELRHGSRSIPVPFVGYAASRGSFGAVPFPLAASPGPPGAGISVPRNNVSFAAPQFSPPPQGAPPSFTAGLPDPASVERQKHSFLRALDESERNGVAALEQQRKQHMEYVCQQAEQQQKQLWIQIDQQVKQSEMALTQQYNQQLLQLNQQYHQQKALLEQQAVQLTVEYQQKAVHEELVRKQYELQREQYEVQQKFHFDMMRLQQAQYAPPPQSGGAIGSNSSVPPGTGSYVPPPTQRWSSQGSYVPPATGSFVPPTQPGQKVTPVVTQPQLPTCHSTSGSGRW